MIDKKKEVLHQTVYSARSLSHWNMLNCTPVVNAHVTSLWSCFYICKHLQGWYSWYSGSNAHFTCISGVVAMGRVSALPFSKHLLAVDDRWSAFLDLVSFERNSTFYILLHSATKTRGKNKWKWLGDSLQNCKAYSGV